MWDNAVRAMKKEINRRIKALPGDYQVVFVEISKYLGQFSANDADVRNMQIDILDMFEAGIGNGRDVLDIVGSDVIGFCDGLLVAGDPQQTWLGKMKYAMNQNIHKRLGRTMDDGK